MESIDCATFSRSTTFILSLSDSEELGGRTAAKLVLGWPNTQKTSANKYVDRKPRSNRRRPQALRSRVKQTNKPALEDREATFVAIISRGTLYAIQNRLGERDVVRRDLSQICVFRVQGEGEGGTVGIFSLGIR